MFKVRVPASTANLGAGYDILGCALGLYNVFHFDESDAFQMTSDGPFGHETDFPMDQTNLVYKAFEHVCQAYQKQPPPLAIHLEINIPPSRGMGSSSTAIVAGLCAGYYWCHGVLDKDHILSLAIELEGHPDNVAPALLGGCQVNYKTEQGSYITSRINVPERLKWVLCYPDFQLSTKKARQVVPEVLSQSDCVLNMGYLSALLLGFTRDQPDLISYGLKDRLHEPYREVLVPGMAAVRQGAIEAGALGCVLSGAGPSLLALTLDNEFEIAEKMTSIWKQSGILSNFVIQPMDHQGASILY